MINIRPAAYIDSAALAKIQVDSYRQAYAGLLPADYLANFSYEEQTYDWQEILTNQPGHLLLVAEDETGVITGYAMGHAGQTSIPEFDSELDGLHVHNTLQRHGIGRALLAAMAARFQIIGARSMMLWVLVQNPMRSLYERLGGEPLGRRAISLGEAGTTGELVAEEVAYGWDDITTLTKA
jgi:ribosomal protein S18 acetylase RimI-like enzyme